MRADGTEAELVMLRDFQDHLDGRGEREERQLGWLGQVSGFSGDLKGRHGSGQGPETRGSEQRA